jgi:hypothetical protein
VEAKEDGAEAGKAVAPLPVGADDEDDERRSRLRPVDPLLGGVRRFLGLRLLTPPVEQAG